jgi:hypothetical protein
MRKAAADLSADKEFQITRSGTTRAEERQALRKEMDAEVLRKDEDWEPKPFFKALGADDEAVDVPTTPAERLAIEQLRLWQAFYQAEGRDPTPADEQYWQAYSKIFQRYQEDPGAWG